MSKHRHIGKQMRWRPFWLPVAVLVVLIFSFAPRPSLACGPCNCESSEIPNTTNDNQTRNQDIRDLFHRLFAELEVWIIGDASNGIWMGRFPELFVNITHQLTDMAIYQTFLLGTLFDAKIQLETQQMMREMAVQAHKDYRPSTSMCYYGTITRSLAASEARSEVNTSIFSRWAQRRHLGHMNTSAAESPQKDFDNRLDAFRKRYCDLTDNNKGMALLCMSTGGPVETANRDINFTRTVGSRLTLNVDLTDTELTDDEADIFALASNLYDHQVSARIPEGTFIVGKPNKANAMDVRSIAAKRSVAESSLFTIAGQKALGSPYNTQGPLGILGRSGSPMTGQYMSLLLQRLGYSRQQTRDPLDFGGGLLGSGLAAGIPGLNIACQAGGLGLSALAGTCSDINTYAYLGTQPSYYAQMEVITKKTFQNPDFYTDLYDSPTNVQRKSVALQAIGLMQDFDTLSSNLRTEMMLSVVLELEIMKLQNSVKKKILGLTSTRQ